MNDNKLHFREYAGVLTAFLVVISYVGIGFVQTAVVVTTATPLEMPKDWMAAMLSLASAALGFLIGKQGHNDNGPSVPLQLPQTLTASIAPAVGENAPQPPLHGQPAAGTVAK